VAARRTQAQIEAALEYGVDIPGRRVFLHGDVDEETIRTAVRGLYLLDGMSAGKIELYVTSYGGNPEDALALHDVTRTLNTPVHTVALGKCQSAAPILVACGEPGHRYATENTQFMLHDGTLEIEGAVAPEALKSSVEAFERVRERYSVLLSRYTKKPKSHWNRLFQSKKDTMFDVKDAIKWGLVDHEWSQKD